MQWQLVNFGMILVISNLIFGYIRTSEAEIEDYGMRIKGCGR